jgi:hypothetical protein
LCNAFYDVVSGTRLRLRCAFAAALASPRADFPPVEIYAPTRRTRAKTRKFAHETKNTEATLRPLSARTPF